MSHLRGRGQQRRGPCPVHSHPGDAERTFSVHLGKNAFQCFHADCAVKGNVLDLWAAIHRLPLYEAALHLAETFQLPRNREEEPVAGTRCPGTRHGNEQWPHGNGSDTRREPITTCEQTM